MSRSGFHKCLALKWLRCSAALPSQFPGEALLPKWQSRQRMAVHNNQTHYWQAATNLECGAIIIPKYTIKPEAMEAPGQACLGAARGRRGDSDHLGPQGDEKGTSTV